MKKLPILMLFLVILSSSMVLGALSYTGYNFPTPASVKSLEYVTDSDGSEYFVYAVQNGATQRLCYANASDSTQLGCSSVNQVNGSDVSYNSATDVYVHARRNVPAVQLLQASLTGSTTGTFLTTSLNALYGVGQNEYTYDHVYANNSKFNYGSDTNLPSSVVGNLYAIDVYNNETIIVLGGANNRTLYQFSDNGTLISTDTIDSYHVPFSPLDVYGKGDKVYVVTQTRIYEFILSQYTLIGGTYYSSTYCVDEFSLCNNTQFVEQPDGTVEFWCDLNDVTRCDGTCDILTKTDAIEGVNYQEGECVAEGCTNECSFNGYQTCGTQTSYIKCGQFDDDSCLDLSGNIACLPNQNCVITGDQNYGGCQDIDFTSYGTLITYPTYSLSPYSITDDNTAYSIDSQGRVLVDTKYNGHVQEYTLQTLSVGTDLYYATNCKYNQNVLFSDLFTNTDLSQTGWVPSTYNVTTDSGERYLDFNATGSLTKIFQDTNENPLIDTKILLTAVNNVSVGKISFGNNIDYGSFIYFERDVNGKNITFYEGNATSNKTTLLFTDTSTNTYDDLVSVRLQTRFNFAIFQYDSYITIEREGATTNYQLTPLNITNVVVSIDRIRYENYNGTMKINYVVGETDLTLPTYRKATLGANALQCVYGETGCFTSRVYVNGNDVPVFNNYEDNVICVNSLGNSNPKQTNTGFLSDVSNLSFGAKILTVLVSILLTFLLVFLPVVIFGKGSATSIIFGTALTSLLIVGELILFTVQGLMEGWVLFLLFVIVGGIIAVVGRKTVMGA